MTATQLIEPSLAKKLLSMHHPDQRITNEAAEAASELIRMFIAEARDRAAVEAECEYEGERSIGDGEDDDDADDEVKVGARGDDRDGAKDKTTTSIATATKMDGRSGFAKIEAHHVAKVAAELLLDFA